MQLGEWDLEAIQAHADFLLFSDPELNLKELKASRQRGRSSALCNRVEPRGVRSL